MRKNEFRKLEKKVGKIEKEWGSLENFVIVSTFDGQKHTMKIEEDFSRDSQLLQVYNDLDDLEFADLLDYQNVSEEYGKFGKKRRHIFC